MENGLKVLLLGPREKEVNVNPPPGVSIVRVPVLRVVYIEDGITRIREILEKPGPKTLVFTSALGVKSVIPRLREVIGELKKGGLRIASIGPSTSRELRRHGIDPDLEPDTYTGRRLGEILCTQDTGTVILARSKRGLREIVDVLRRCGKKVLDIAVYDVVPEPQAARRAIELLERGEADAAILTSPMIARILLGTSRNKEQLKFISNRLIAIGETTAREVRQLTGIEAPYPSKYTIEAALQLVMHILQRKSIER